MLQIGLLVAAVAAMLAAGAWLLWTGRPRRSGDHPTCRRCGFDLRGAASAGPEGGGGGDAAPGGIDRASGARTCAECGGDLSAAGSVSRGDRVVHRPRLVAGGLLAVLSLVLAAAAAGLLRGPAMPTWWLVHVDAGLFRSVTAVDELVRRLGDPVPPRDEVVAEAARIALARQASEARRLREQRSRDGRVGPRPDTDWPEAWSEVVVEAGERGLLTDEQTIAFVRHASIPVMRVFPPNRARELRVRLDLFGGLGRNPLHAGAPGPFASRIGGASLRIAGVEVAGQAIEVGRGGSRAGFGSRAWWAICGGPRSSPSRSR